MTSKYFPFVFFVLRTSSVSSQFILSEQEQLFFVTFLFFLWLYSSAENRFIFCFQTSTERRASETAGAPNPNSTGAADWWRLPHLLLAWEGVVVTRHISHDGLLIRPQGANDVWREQRRRTEERKRRVKDCKHKKRTSRGRNHQSRFCPGLSAVWPEDAMDGEEPEGAGCSRNVFKTLQQKLDQTRRIRFLT